MWSSLAMCNYHHDDRDLLYGQHGCGTWPVRDIVDGDGRSVPAELLYKADFDLLWVYFYSGDGAEDVRGGDGWVVDPWLVPAMAWFTTARSAQWHWELGSRRHPGAPRNGVSYGPGEGEFPEP